MLRSSLAPGLGLAPVTCLVRLCPGQEAHGGWGQVPQASSSLFLLAAMSG